MPFKPFAYRLLAQERLEEWLRIQQAAREAARYALARRQENEAKLKLSETRKRVGGWS